MKITTNKRILWVLAAAVALCIISAAGIYMFLAPQRGTVYVFREDYTAGTQVTKEQLMPIEVDATIIEMGEAADISEQYVTAEEYSEVLQNAGVLRYDVARGTASMKSMLTGYGGSKVEMAMRKPVTNYEDVIITIGRQKGKNYTVAQLAEKDMDSLLYIANTFPRQISPISGPRQEQVDACQRWLKEHSHTAGKNVA